MRTPVIVGVLILACGTGAHAQAPAPLFTSHEVVELRLEAPLLELFESSRVDENHQVSATVSYQDPASGQVQAVSARLATRGNTSRRPGECTFPKLQLTFARETAGLFQGIGTLKIGTHCDERPDGELTPRYGRWQNEKGPHREAFVYRLLEAMEVPAMKARPARITYVSTDAGAGSAREIVRHAMLLEDDEAAIARFGGRQEIDRKRFTAARAIFSAADTARLHFAQALIGNFDWCLRLTEDDTYRCNDTSPLWNITAVDRGPTQPALPVMHDFDLSGYVTLRHPWFGKVFIEEFASSPMAVEVIAQVQRTRSLFPRELLDGTRAAFAARKPAAYTALAAAPLDEEGRRVATAYIDAFFAAIETDAAFYRPVVAAAATRASLDASASTPICEASTVPRGTPVSEPIDRRDEMVRVRLLDVMWHWSERCEAVRREPVWIPAAAVSTAYPN